MVLIYVYGRITGMQFLEPVIFLQEYNFPLDIWTVGVSRVKCVFKVTDMTIYEFVVKVSQ